MEIICPHCGFEDDVDCDLLRIYLGQGLGHCYECDRDYDLEATEVEATKEKDE
jgi:hypothetical protein